jgi:signal transduction histidine kinase
MIGRCMSRDPEGRDPLPDEGARRRTLEVELRRAREAQEAAKRARGRLLANVSHELRTPLNAILGYTELLLEEARGEGGERFRADLEKIDAAGRSLLSVVEALLDFSKVSEGRLELSVAPFDPSPLLEEVAATLVPLSRKNGNRLEVRGGAPATMRSDAGKVRQILHALLSNAIKFTENGRIVASLRFEERGGGRWAVVHVSDTGIGITPAQLLSLFQPFGQGDASLTRKYGGTGLGLALAQSLAQALGGEIAVESEEGMGTLFTVALPADLAPALAAEGEGS